ncbi:MAG TPA: GDSL-type esterase/lipase family protein [Gemmataceae bacterium]|nr:GDSL-type esterase/lipase family protein [Gemmataceae bacterium]
MVRRTGPLVVLALLSAACLADAAEPSRPTLPKVVLIGDSIRLGYAALVAKQLEGQAIVVSPAANGGDSSNVLKHLDEWVIREKPDVIHLNCGLHDLKLSKRDKRYQVDREKYEANLKEIVARLRKETSATLVFANTTPILDDRHAKRGAGFDRHELDVRHYNETSIAVMRQTNVPIDDLHTVVEKAGAEKVLAKDGTHYTQEGYSRLAAAVADCVRRQLILRRARPSAAVVANPEAGTRYRKAEAERDALVPRAYRDIKVPEFAVPPSADEWRQRRPQILKTVVQSLGDLPPRSSPQRVRLVSRELRHGYTVEHVAIDNGVDSEVSALLLLPDKRTKPAPAILWLHSSTPDKTQILTPHTNGGAEPLGEVFVRAGYVVLAPDAYWHGERVGTGPSGRAELGVKEQEALFKLHLWMGRTLWGMFVRDDQIALDYLYDRPEVDRTRIGATGMSMGSTRAWWLAAIDDRVAAVVGVACLTRYQNLIWHGQLRQHGVYYFVNGLLKHFDTEGVIALIAPRPYLALTGELDAGSPADGIKVIEAKASAVYAALDVRDHFKSIRYADIGHTYTPAMRKEMLAWFARWLKPEVGK